MSDEELQEIRARCAAATRGPWLWRSSIKHPEEWTTPSGRFDVEEGAVAWSVIGGYPEDPSDGWTILHGEAGNGTIIPNENDLAFVAHAREDVPALLAEVERLRTELRAKILAELASEAQELDMGY